LQNSQCTLNGATSTASGSGDTLTMHFGLSFAAGYFGTKNLYEQVIGSVGSAVWQQEGTWTTGTPPAPTNVSLAPNSGSGLSQVFTATYSDLMGYQDIGVAAFMAAGNASGLNSCFVLWQQSGNSLYLGNDAGTGWLGPIASGGSGTLQNSQCALSGATSTAGGSGNTLTVHFGLTFANGYVGLKNTYLLSSGSGGSNGWQQLGTWAPQIPTDVSVSPNAGSGTNQVFTATYGDVQGYQDVADAFFMVSANTSGTSSCFVMWQSSNSSFYMGNDAGTGWLGPLPAGSGSALQNSQCTLHGATSTASGAGNTLTLHFGLTFASGYPGTKNLYEMVIGSSGATSWQQEGTWTTSTPPAPNNVSVAPNAGAGTPQVFTATYTDLAGYQDIGEAGLMVAGNATGASSCFVLWQQAGNSLYLGNDAGTGWLGPIQAGGGGTLQNSQCTLSGATSTASGSGTTLTVHFGLAFANGYTGLKNTYLLSSGSGGNNGWQPLGTWTP
jgi:hypothetical protein